MNPKSFTMATTALFSASEQTHCALVVCDPERLTVAVYLYTGRFAYPPKWCTSSAVYLLHGCCHVKLPPGFFTRYCGNRGGTDAEITVSTES